MEDELLLHLAKERVNERRKFDKHLIAFIVSLPLLALFSISVFEYVEHPRASHAQSVVWQLQDVVLPLVPEADTETAEGIVNQAVWVIERATGSDYMPPIWYCILGGVGVWGAWIAAYFARIYLKKFRAAHAGKVNPDPVAIEYRKLKSMTPGSIL